MVMQFAKRFVPWTLALGLVLAVGCAQQNDKGPNKKPCSPPAKAERTVKLTATEKQPQKNTNQVNQPGQQNQVINKQQIADQIRKAAANQKTKPPVQNAKTNTKTPGTKAGAANTKAGTVVPHGTVRQAQVGHLQSATAKVNYKGKPVTAKSGNGQAPKN
jgi:predicted outer membrane protein